MNEGKNSTSVVLESERTFLNSILSKRAHGCEMFAHTLPLEGIKECVCVRCIETKKTIVAFGKHDYNRAKNSLAKT